MSGAPLGAGLRFELRLLSTAEGGASYALELTFAEETRLGEARISGQGEVVFVWSDGQAAPDWCTQVVRAQLRTLWRDSMAQGSYPRRLTRWRPAPAGANGP